METIEASEALYIKLGSNGVWERDCIEVEQILRLGYQDIPHELCQVGEWEKVRERFKKNGNTDGVATSHKNQIKRFYESGTDVLWVTFFGDHLWWCFSQNEIELCSNKTKIRHCLSRWSNTDVKGDPLSFHTLSGKLLSMQGFRGTICSVAESRYLIERINGRESEEITEARAVKTAFEQQIEKIIRHLHWRDFEILIDLIFRQAGWKRVSDLGKNIKTHDIELISPITEERFGVQVKSEADLKTFKTYQTACHENMKGFACFYFAVHTPSDDLNEAKCSTDENVKLLLPPRLAHLSVEFGLANWVFDKAR